MKYFVYYEDGYADNGDIGMDEFDTSEEAEEFITKRIAQNPRERNVSDYKVVRGELCGIIEKKVVTKVHIL